MSAIRLSRWAKENGYSYQGAYDMYARGDLPNAYQLPSGSIMVKNDTQKTEEKQEKVVIYARVSTPKQKDDLDRQASRLEGFCAARGMVVSKTVKEIASGLNDHRTKLTAILQDKSITTIVVEHKDRLTRFGFNYISNLLACDGRSILVINDADSKDQDLMQDFVSIITSMAARVYGTRRSKRKTQEIISVVSDVS